MDDYLGPPRNLEEAVESAHRLLDQYQANIASPIPHTTGGWIMETLRLLVDATDQLEARYEQVIVNGTLRLPDGSVFVGIADDPVFRKLPSPEETP